jgi:hypothetical protein
MQSNFVSRKETSRELLFDSAIEPAGADQTAVNGRQVDRGLRAGLVHGHSFVLRH